MQSDYYKNKESVDEYIEMAKDVNSSGLINKLKNYLPANSLILEIGSGPGTDFQLLKKSYKVIGSDYSDEFVKRLKNNNPNDEFLNLDAMTLTTDTKFDGIYSNKVMQHLTDTELEESVKRQVEIINPGGIVAHSFWKGEGDEIFNGMYVNYQYSASLKNIFEQYFDILLLEEYKEFEDADSLFLVGRKK